MAVVWRPRSPLLSPPRGAQRPRGGGAVPAVHPGV